jgi:acyl-CoA dehydrogenase
MVDFKLTDEQKQYQQLARDFAGKEIVPAAAHLDETAEFPEALLRKAWELGLMNVRLPEQYGGMALNLLDACLIAEEIGAACSAVGSHMLANDLAVAPLLVAGSEQQKKEFLEPLTGELSFAAYCVNEPGRNSRLSGLKTTARREGDDYIVNGQKAWVTNGSSASWYLVLAGQTEQPERLTLFIVPRGTDGLAAGPKQVSLGQRATDRCKVDFDEVRIPARFRLGEEGEGAEIIATACGLTDPLVASACVGLSRSALEHSIRYAKERSTFGVAIASHQAISFLLADMAKDIEAARLLTWQSAWLADNGVCSRREAETAKTFAADTAARVASDAVQIFGGYGYSREYPVEKLMRDAKMFQIYEGTSQLAKVKIGKELVGSCFL